MSQKSAGGASISANHSSWNRTPGKPSTVNSQANMTNANWGVETSQGSNLTEDMWSNNISNSRSKGWPVIDAPVSHENIGNFPGQIGATPAWGVNTNNFLPGAQNSSSGTTSNNVWGSSISSNNSVSGPRPIRGPQLPNQTNNNMLDQRSRQFSGWNIDTNKDTPFSALNVSTSNNVTENVNSNELMYSGSNASLIKRQSSRDGQKSGPSLSDLNALLNTLNNQTSNSNELEEVLKAIINVNDSWGQRIVDQSQPWDFGSLSNDENSNSPVVAHPASNTGASNPIGGSNAGAFSNNPNQMQVLNAQRRMKQVTGTYESNVWPNEPPNGTGIWEAHYENLGERAGWQTNATSQNTLPSPSNNYPVIPGVNNPLSNRNVSFGNNGRQSTGAGYRPLVSNTWNEENTQLPNQLWNNQSAMNDIPTVGSGNMSARAINKNVMQTNTPSGRWPPTNHPPPPTIPGPDTFQGSWSSNPQSDPRKFSSVNNNWNGNDYRNMMLQPPPQMPQSRLPPMHHPNITPHNPPTQGYFRANVMRHLLNMGFTEEEIQTAMVENNMDVERALNDLRAKSSHVGIDALLNPVSSILYSSKFPHSQSHGQMDSNDYNIQSSMNNGMLLRQPQQSMNNIGLRGPNNQNSNIDMVQQNQQGSNMNTELTLNMMQQRESAILQQIMQLHNKSSELNQKINQLIASNVSSSSAMLKNLQQQRDQILQQIQSFQSQLKNIRNQAAIVRMVGTNGGSNPNMMNRPISSSGMQNQNCGDFLADKMMSDMRINNFPNDASKNFNSWESNVSTGDNVNSMWSNNNSSSNNNFRGGEAVVDSGKGATATTASDGSQSLPHSNAPPSTVPSTNGANASSPLGGDRRWGAVVVSSSSGGAVVGGNGSGVATSGSWAVKASSAPRGSRWVLLRELPAHVNVEVIKLSIGAALNAAEGSGGGGLVKEFESHPNMVARWCLISVAGPQEVNAVINFLSASEPGGARFGIPEAISNLEAMKRLEEIKNLAPRGFSSGQSNMWSATNTDHNNALVENSQNPSSAVAED